MLSLISHHESHHQRSGNAQHKMTPASASDSNRVITLDVGGTRFCTTAQTLCSVQHSWFWNRWSSGTAFQQDAVTEGPPVFIGRDPAVFPIILTYPPHRPAHLAAQHRAPDWP